MRNPIAPVRELFARSPATVAAVGAVALGLFLWLTPEGWQAATLRLAVPIALAAIGGIFAEKSGVINIGIEGLLIVSAFSAIIVTFWLGSGESTMAVSNHWWGLFAGVLVSTGFALLFAIVCIEFKADQIIAGLALWLIALGLAPFVSRIVFDSPNTGNVGTFDAVTIPVLSELPLVGHLLFDTPPQVYLMLGAVIFGWYVFNRTSFGRWIVASGENPKALDTAGVDVRKVRYTAVLLSGVFAGLGGAGLALGQLGTFAGGGETDIQGRGFIAIATYLLANYHPIGALGGSLLFAGLDAMQLRLQGAGYAVPTDLVQAIPYITVVVVIAFVGKTRLPEAAGENYESGDD
jgi:general nucleoside transport system permease protein